MAKQKRPFVGSWPFGFVVSGAIAAVLLFFGWLQWHSSMDAVRLKMIRPDEASRTIAQVSINLSEIGVVLIGAFWIFVFPRTRKKWQSEREEGFLTQHKQRPLAVSKEFFEAVCPRCNARIAIYPNDPVQLTCGCGVALEIDRRSDGTGSLIEKR
jgi:hypothetical protein